MSKSTTSTQEQARTEIDPELKRKYLDNYAQAQQYGTYMNEKGPYMGDRVAGTGEGFDKATGIVNNFAAGMAKDIPGWAPSQSLIASSDMINNARDTPWLQVSGAGYDPTKFQLRGSTVDPAHANLYQVDRAGIRDVSPGQIYSGMAPYQNAYTDGVIGRGLLDLDRSRQMALQGNSAEAIRNKAFGGSRQAVMDSETNRAFMDSANRFVADQRSQAFDKAAALSGQDVSNAMQATQANQGVDLNAALASLQSLNAGSQFNAGNTQQANMASAQFGQQAGMANQQAMLDAQKFNAGNAQQAQMANQQANFQDVNNQMQLAQMYQALAGQQYALPMDMVSKLMGLEQYGRGVTNDQLLAKQQLWDDQRYQYLPGMQLQSAALGMQLPNLGMSSTGSSKTTYQPSGLQTIGQIASLAGLAAR